MLDINFIRKEPELVDIALRRRGENPVSQQILLLDKELRGLLTKIQTLQEKKNHYASLMQRSRDDETIRQASMLRAELAGLEDKASVLKKELNEAMLAIPNLPEAECPDGEDESGNIERFNYGKKPVFDFEPLEHQILGDKLGYIEIEEAAKISGSRFSILKGPLARLERALAQFMLDTNVNDFGYCEMYVPQIVRTEALYGTGNLPKFEEDLFKLNGDFWLIPTAEVPLTNTVREKILNEQDLPIRITAYTQCFRSEVGAAGKDIKGIFRQHQFSKVELVSITLPKQESEEHERMTKAAENILQKLGLSYRVMLLCAGDMGFCSKKTYDLEVWLPGQKRYREISSCSKCGDFQARRMNARYRTLNGDKKTDFVCTLNGSGLAVGRTLIAIMETYQQKDGSIKIPEKLINYMGGMEIITK